MDPDQLIDAAAHARVADPIRADDGGVFCGFSFSDIAAMRGVSERTVQRDWNKPGVFLRCTLQDD